MRACLKQWNHFFFFYVTSCEWKKSGWKIKKWIILSRTWWRDVTDRYTSHSCSGHTFLHCYCCVSSFNNTVFVYPCHHRHLVLSCHTLPFYYVSIMWVCDGLKPVAVLTERRCVYLSATTEKHAVTLRRSSWFPPDSQVVLYSTRTASRGQQPTAPSQETETGWMRVVGFIMTGIRDEGGDRVLTLMVIDDEIKRDVIISI